MPTPLASDLRVRALRGVAAAGQELSALTTLDELPARGPVALLKEDLVLVLLVTCVGCTRRTAACVMACREAFLGHLCPI